MQKQVEDLKVWQEAICLVKTVYSLTQTFPKEEVYGLTSQMRRAAVSIPANIAEGKARQHKRDCVQFLFIARGSIYELGTLVQIARELEYIDQNLLEELRADLQEITAMLNGLINSIK